MVYFSESADVVLVGGGIANIMCALKLIGTNKKVLLIEQGNDIYHRKCPKLTTGKCANCKNCSITTGFGGAGFFSDCKLTYSSDVGGDVADYIGKDNFNRLLNDVSDTFTEFGAREEYVYNEEFANSFQYECSKYGLRLTKYPVRHLGTDGAYDVMKNIYDTLEAAENITVVCNVKDVTIDFKDKIVGFSKANGHFAYEADYISIAVGRSGSEWLSNLCKANGIKVSAGLVDLGVRVECPRAITDKVTDNLYDFKVSYNSSTGCNCRTFCVNPGGHVVSEVYADDHTSAIKCVNGHSFAENESPSTNFAILVSCLFTEPFNQPIEYAKRVCSLVNMLADDKPMVQRLVDLQANKRTNDERLKRVIFDPTLTGVSPGDLRYAYPSKIIDSILEFLDKLDNVIPGISSPGNSTILYGPECKFSSAKLELNNKLQNDKYPNVYFAGDSAGISRGIMQAAVAGMFIAEDILKGE